MSGPIAHTAAHRALNYRLFVQIRFVVVHGQPGARLVDCVVHPHAVIAAAGRLQLNGQYYIIKQILPALDRLFSLLGVDVASWFTEMAKPQRLLPHKRALTSLPLRALLALTANAFVANAPGCAGDVC